MDSSAADLKLKIFSTNFQIKILKICLRVGIDHVR